MLRPYFAIMFLMLISILFAVVTVALSHLLGPKKTTKVKSDPYECGVTTIGHTWERIPIKFYIIAMLFLVFDVEAVFIYPWAVIFKRLSLFGFIEMMIFIIVLFLGLIYVWKKGALKWE